VVTPRVTELSLLSAHPSVEIGGWAPRPPSYGDATERVRDARLEITQVGQSTATPHRSPIGSDADHGAGRLPD